MPPFVVHTLAWLRDFERAVLTALAAIVALLALTVIGSAMTASGGADGERRAASGASLAVSQIAPAALKQVRRNGYIGANYVRRFPAGWDRKLKPRDRKSVFLHAVLPLVLAENKRIDTLRRRLVAVLSSRSAASTDRAWLAALAGRYGVASGDHGELLRRVDTVLPSLALAQAAVESAWGTSRFALKGNALYGQWTNREGGGLVPDGRNAGASHEVRVFADLSRSVASYMHNLNTHAAYAKFRKRRAEGRAGRRWVAADEFAPDLASYSQRRHHYVQTLRRVIADNRLDGFDTIRLRPLH